MPSAKKSALEDPRLVRLTKICLALPEVDRWYNGQHASFSVRKKSFVWFLNDHHGDGIVAVTGKVLPADNKAHVGAKGWVGLRLDAGKVDWNEVSELVRGSYQLIAPKRLAERVCE